MSSNRPVLGRFAPTPSGRMHLGNVFSALMAWLSARSAGGELLLRIEDLDTLRCTDENAEIIRQDLRRLGLTWDYETPPQHTRSAYYEEVLAELRERGEVYPCWCTRGDLKNVLNAPHAADGHPVYPGTCRALSEEERRSRTQKKAPLLRLRVPEEEISFTDTIFGEYRENLARDCGDFILRRADGVFTYQLAVTADDIAAGVTQVVRGSDLLSSTPRQLYIYRLLGAPEPAFTHVPLLTAPDGRRLSKRDADLDLGVLFQSYTAPQLLGALAAAAGLIPKYDECTAEELVPLYNPQKIGTADREVRLPAPNRQKT